MNKKKQPKESTLNAQDQADSESPANISSAAKDLADQITGVLDEHSAQDTILIDIKGKSSVADYMLISSGRSNRHVAALSDYVMRFLKENGHKGIGIEGADAADWVLIDAGDVVLHIFRPEVRAFYNLEKIWSVPLPDSVKVFEQHPDT